MGEPACASSPATMPQMAKTEPTEMSISPARITSAAPIATISTGTLPSSRSDRFSRLKNPGARTASSAQSAAIVNATDTTLRSGNRELQHLVLRGLGARQRAANRSGAHHGNAIAHAEDLRQLRRDHDDRETAPGKRAHQLVDLCFRSDVDALGRLVEDQDR